MRPRQLLIPLALLLGVPLVRAQESATRFDAPLVVVNQYRRLDVLLDLDGDGYQDAVGWWGGAAEDTTEITGFRNQQDGSFAQKWQVIADYYPYSGYKESIAAGDLDQDGMDDFAISLHQDVYVYHAKANGAPALAQQWQEPNQVDSMVAADFNGDLALDLAVLTDGELKIYLKISGAFVLTSTTSAFGTQLVKTEVNGDGSPDLLAVDSLFVRLYPVVAGQIGTEVDYQHHTDEPMPTAGDIDGDHDEDIVIFDMMEYTVLRRTGPTTFSVEPLVSGGPATNLADIDQDGDLDGICCGGGGYTQPQNESRAIFRVSLNDGTGRFASAFEIVGLGARHIAGAADVDHDGDIDLVAGRCVYYCRGSWAQNPEPPLGVTQESDADLVDADGDSDPDAGFAYWTRMLNVGDGTFASFHPVSPEPPAGTGYRGPGFPGDFDGDGDTDLLVSHEQTAGGFLGMRLLENNGGGGFTDGGYAAGAGVDMNEPGSAPRNAPELMLAADAEGDGDIDLFIHSNSTSPTGRSWLNDGSGHFTVGQDLPYVVVQHVRDFNGDKIPDLLLAKQSSVVVRLGLGNGLFGDPITLVGSTQIYDRLEAADLDSDGDVDICVVDQTRVRLYVNDGLANFTGTEPFPPAGYGSARRCVFATDVNQDGLPDVVFAPAMWAASGTNIILRNASNTGWQTPVMQAFDPGCIADVDGDGDEDCLGSTVVRNHHWEGAAAGTRRQYGTGTSGSGSMVPTLGAKGPLRVGENCEFRLSGALGHTVALLAIGLSESNVPNFPYPGMTSYCQPWSWLLVLPVGGPAGVPGAGGFTLPYGVPPAAAGVRLFHQVLVADPGASHGLSSTGGLELGYGP